jgi:hypothetical protein
MYYLGKYYIGKYKLTEKQNLKENQRFYEMGDTLGKRVTGLPVNIWLDNMAWESPKLHIKRIKFQPNKEDKITDLDIFIPMSIEDNPEILLKNPPKLELDSKDIESIKSFIKLNQEILIKHSVQEIDIFEFLELMKKV